MQHKQRIPERTPSHHAGFKATAPGSLILLGEYAVLYGKPAVVAAIDKRIVVTLLPRADQEIHLESSLYPAYHTKLSHLEIVKPYQFVLGALKQYQDKMKWGCNIHITSEFSDKVGLGSSAAVTIATLATLVMWLDIRMTALDLVRQGIRVVRLVQGIGSGADMAASVYGGIIAYQPYPFGVEKFPLTHPLTSWYAGYKTATVVAIKQVQMHFANYPLLFRDLCQSIGQCALAGIQLIREARHPDRSEESWMKFGTMMNTQQGLMEALGVSNPLLHEMIHLLREQKEIIGAKISGSGLGDCVIGLGEAKEAISKTKGMIEAGAEAIPLNMTLQGVQCEKI